MTAFTNLTFLTVHTNFCAYQFPPHLCKKGVVPNYVEKLCILH